MSARRRVEERPDKVEVTCIRCGFTKKWTQKQWDRHMWLVHEINNEIHIGKDPRPEKQKRLV